MMFGFEMETPTKTPVMNEISMRMIIVSIVTNLLWLKENDNQ